MSDRIRPIVLATLANLSKTEEGGNNRSFSILDIATRAAQVFGLDSDELRQTLKTYLTEAVNSGEDAHIAGDSWNGSYKLTHAGQAFQATIVAAAAATASYQQPIPAIVPPTTSDGHSSVTGKQGREQQGSSSSSSSSSRPASKTSTGKPVKSGNSGNNHKKASSSSSSSSSSSMTRAERELLELGVIHGKQVDTLIGGRSRHQMSAPVETANHQQKQTAATAANSGKGATRKKPSMASSQPTVKTHHGGGRPAKPVEQYDLSTGRTIATFDSHGDAARVTGIDRGYISSFVRGKNKSAGGFGWRNPGTGGAVAGVANGKGATSKKPLLSNNQPSGKEPHSRAPWPVTQYDLISGKTIAEFDSRGAESRATSIPGSSIQDCIAWNLKHAGGYGWRKSEAAGAAASSSSQLAEKKRKAEKMPSTTGREQCSETRSSSSSDRTASNSQSSSKKPRVGGVHNSKPVEQFNVTSGRSIAHFDSQSDAARATGIDQAVISQCVSGKLNHTGKFGWRRPGKLGEARATDSANGSHQPRPASPAAATPSQQTGTKRKAEKISPPSTRLTSNGQPSAAGAAAMGSRKVVVSSAAATATKNSTTDKRSRISSGGVIPRRFQRPDPFNTSLSKVTSVNAGSDGDNDVDDDHGDAGVKPRRGRPPMPESDVNKPVEQFILASGRTIQRFNSQSDAARSTGIGQGSIYQCVRGEQKSAGGYGWRKEDKEGAARIKHEGMPLSSSSSSSSSSSIRIQGVGSAGDHDQGSLAVVGRDESEEGEQEDNKEDAPFDDNYGAYGEDENEDDGHFSLGVDRYQTNIPSSASALANVPLNPWSLALSLTSSLSSSRAGAASALVPTTESATAHAGSDDKDAANDDDVDDVGSVETEEDPCGMAARGASTTAPVSVTPASHTVPTLSASSSSSSASSSSTCPASVPPTITEHQRQQMRDAIFDILLNNIYKGLTVGENELLQLAENIERILYQDSLDEYLEFFDDVSRLLIKIIVDPSIKALCK